MHETKNWKDKVEIVLQDWSTSSSTVIISPDVDGIVSASLLATRFPVHIIGVYTTTNLHLFDGASKADAAKALWLDHDVSEPGVRCIGQHLIQLRSNDSLSLREEISFNPNYWIGQSWDASFKGINGKKRDKYPYATCHLIASALGVVPDANISEFGALLAHADGTWRTVVDYSANARIWFDLMFSDSLFLDFLQVDWHQTPEAKKIHGEVVDKLIEKGVGKQASRAKRAQLLPEEDKRLTGRQSIAKKKSAKEYLALVSSVLEYCSAVIGTSPTIGKNPTSLIPGNRKTHYPNRIENLDKFMIEEKVFSHAITNQITLSFTNGITLQ